MMRKKTFRKYKNEIIKVAKELHYGEDVIRELKTVESEEQIDRIMRSARLKERR